MSLNKIYITWTTKLTIFWWVSFWKEATFCFAPTENFVTKIKGIASEVETWRNRDIRYNYLNDRHALTGAHIFLNFW